jgi:hypothetical protein
MVPGYPDPYPFGAPELGPVPVRTVPPVAQLLAPPPPPPLSPSAPPAPGQAPALVGTSVPPPGPPAAVASPGSASPVPLAVAVASPVPLAAAVVSPAPVLRPAPPVLEPLPGEGEGGPRPAFSSRLVAGLELPMAWRESFEAGRSDTSVPVGLGAGVQWDHWLTPTVGLGLSARSVGFVIEDPAVGPRFQVRHRRDDTELAAALRGRWPLGFGVEALAASGLVVRGVSSLTTQAVVTAGTPGSAVEVDTTDWLSANWLAFGGDVRAGLGWRLMPALAWTAWGDYRVLPTGQVLTSGVSPFFPLHGWRLGTELRYEVSPFELSLGWVQLSDSHTGTTPDRSLSQAGGLLQLRAGWVY